MIEFPEYQEAQMMLEKNDIFVAPSEVHGAISGLLACGLNIDKDEYLTILRDVFNEGQAFSNELNDFFAKLYSQVFEGFTDEEFHFELYLPSADESMTDQANGLVSWVAGFMLGFGLKQRDYGKLSADIKEIIKDFTEISRLDTAFDDGEDDEAALHEIIEYVRVSSLLCFAEMGKEPSIKTKKKTLH